MELQKIKQLIDVLAASDLAELELVEGDHRVRLVKRLGAPAVPEPARPGLAPPAPKRIAAPSPHEPDAARDTGECVKAPLYGVVHLTPSPGAPVFVRVGDTVRPGQTLCMVEAMKMFHEVQARQAGVIAAIHAVAGEEAEAGAVLFRLAPPEAA